MLSNLLSYNCVYYSFVILFISLSSVVMPLFFPEFRNFSFFFLFLINLAKTLSLLLIFSTNQVLVLWIFSTVFLIIFH